MQIYRTDLSVASPAIWRKSHLLENCSCFPTIAGEGARDPSKKVIGVYPCESAARLSGRTEATAASLCVADIFGPDRVWCDYSFDY